MGYNMVINIYIYPEKGLRRLIFCRRRYQFDHCRGPEINNKVYMVCFWKFPEMWVSNSCNVKRMEKCLGWQDQNMANKKGNYEN